MVAECVVHPGATVVFTCSRCGNFGCEACEAEYLPPRCQRCQARVDAARDVTTLDLLSETRQAVVALFPWVTLLAALVATVISANNHFIHERGLSSLSSIPIGALAIALWTSLFGEVSHPNEGVSPFRVFVRAIRAFPMVLGLGVLASMPVVLGLAFFLAPGLYLMGGWLLAFPMTVLGGRSATGALALSWKLTRAKRWAIFRAVAVCMSLYVFMAFAIQAVAPFLATWSPSMPSTATYGFRAFVLSLAQAPLYGLAVVAFRRLDRS